MLLPAQEGQTSLLPPPVPGQQGAGIAVPRLGVGVGEGKEGKAQIWEDFRQGVAFKGLGVGGASPSPEILCASGPACPCSSHRCPPGLSAHTSSEGGSPGEGGLRAVSRSPVPLLTLTSWVRVQVSGGPDLGQSFFFSDGHLSGSLGN